MSTTELFIAQLDWSVEEGALEQLFSQCGEVLSVKIPIDKMTGRKRGFAFVAMASLEEAQHAIQTLDQYELNGRAIVVKIAEPRAPREGRPPQRSGGYGGGGGRQERYGSRPY